MGEVDPVQEVPRLAKQLREEPALNAPVIAEGFRIAVTEQPFKIPYYAALLRELYDPPADAEESTSSSPTLGRQILEDFWKGFQASLDKLVWREMRLSVSFLM
ncbi:hypothetical protein QCA50_012518 [Cerrena zonata]|uniref:Uncharacterized protein n=1 Tax=Cerrena zonata TaxID=2478898 RepID=A0AAW0G4F2_9APHY